MFHSVAGRCDGSPRSSNSSCSIRHDRNHCSEEKTKKQRCIYTHTQKIYVITYTTLSTNLFATEAKHPPTDTNATATDDMNINHSYRGVMIPNPLPATMQENNYAAIMLTKPRLYRMIIIAHSVII